MSIDHDDATPLYIQLAGILRTRIETGELTGRLPSIRTLTQEYDVAHVTAEKAIGILRDEGLIVTTIGRGSFVKRPSQHRPAMFAACFVAEIANEDLKLPRDDRRELVAALRMDGMGAEAIGPVVGTSPDTAARDIAVSANAGTEFPPITRKDGKSYPALRACDA